MDTTIFMKSGSQLSLDGMKTRLIHGGDTRKGQRKIERPIATKKSMHVILRSSVARGRYSLLQTQHARFIEKILVSKGRKHGVRIEQQANSGNHLHLLVRAQTRTGFQNCLRDVTGKIAQKITGAKKGNAFGKRFWDVLAFSRLVQAGQD